MRLPPKETFRAQIYEECDENKDKKLDLHEIRRFVEKKRKKTIKEERKGGIHKEEREAQAARALIQADAQAKMKQSAELEAKKKTENESDGFSDCIVFEWLGDLWTNVSKYVGAS